MVHVVHPRLTKEHLMQMVALKHKDIPDQVIVVPESTADVLKAQSGWRDAPKTEQPEAAPKES